MTTRINVDRLLSACSSGDSGVIDMSLVSRMVACVSVHRDELGSVAFGNDTRTRFFTGLDASMVSLNHGSFGSVPRMVSDAHTRLLDVVERQPDVWFRHTLWPAWQQCVQRMAKMINTPHADDVVFVENATTAFQVAIKAVARQLVEGDELMVSQFVYGPVIHGMEVVAAHAGLGLVQLPLQVPVSSADDLVAVIRDGLDAQPRVKCVVIDHVSSNTAVVWPVKRIIELCRARDVIVVVDGAHAICQVEVDIADLQPDFYTSNLHKWAFSPRGCAFLYTHPRHQAHTEPLVVSWSYQEGYQRRFWMQATRDYTPYIVSAAAALEFCACVGVSRMQTYNRQLCRDGSQVLYTRLGGGGGGDLAALAICPPSMNANMCLVALPIVDSEMVNEAAVKSVAAEAIMHALAVKYRCVCPVMSINGRIFVRISCNIYNTIDDYHRLATALAAIINDFGEPQEEPEEEQ